MLGKVETSLRVRLFRIFRNKNVFQNIYSGIYSGYSAHENRYYGMRIVPKQTLTRIISIILILD